MGDVRFPDKPVSNVFDYLYGENNGKVIKIKEEDVGSGYDLVIGAINHPAGDINVSNYEIISGNASDVLAKCENGKAPKVLLVYEHEYEGFTKNYYESKSVESFSGDGDKSIWFNFDISEYGRLYRLAIEIREEDIGNNKISNVSDVREYDAKIEFNIKDAAGDIRVEDVVFSIYEIKRIWEMVRNHKKVDILLTGKCRINTGSGIYPAEFKVININAESDILYIGFFVSGILDSIIGVVTIIFFVGDIVTLQDIRKGALNITWA